MQSKQFNQYQINLSLCLFTVTEQIVGEVHHDNRATVQHSTSFLLRNHDLKENKKKKR